MGEGAGIFETFSVFLDDFFLVGFVGTFDG
jgi:hypothetical protein